MRAHACHRRATGRCSPQTMKGSHPPCRRAVREHKTVGLHPTIRCGCEEMAPKRVLSDHTWSRSKGVSLARTVPGHNAHAHRRQFTAAELQGTNVVTPRCFHVSTCSQGGGCSVVAVKPSSVKFTRSYQVNMAAARHKSTTTPLYRRSQARRNDLAAAP